ncbi:hypothetical protein [Nocardia asteroides]|uniref:hypothetical protein n=1 Tax=Nocardia asteroides TaxID=1824 RepID=UPI0033EEEE8E
MDAADLRYQSTASIGPFECAGCRSSVTVVALQSKVVSTHFRTPKGQTHHRGCSVVGPTIEVPGGGNSADAQTQRKSGTAFPYRLVRTAEREVVSDTTTEPSERQRSHGRDRVRESAGGDKPREVPAATIRRFASTFAEHPSLRAKLRIDIPEIDAAYYQFAFKRLASYSIASYAHTRIFYAEIAWKVAPEFSAAAVVVTLHAGDRDRSNRARVVRPYQVVIDWSGWNQLRRDALRNEIATAQIEARKAGGAGNKSWMFFLAAPDPNNPATFRIDHYSNYAFVIATIAPLPKGTAAKADSSRARPSSPPIARRWQKRR